MTGSLTIGTLAKQAAVNVETIRFYQRRRLLDEPDKPPGGIRRYTQTHARRIRFIKEAQKLGFGLDEVADLLALETAGIAAKSRRSRPTSWQWCVSGCAN